MTWKTWGFPDFCTFSGSIAYLTLILLFLQALHSTKWVLSFKGQNFAIRWSWEAHEDRDKMRKGPELLGKKRKQHSVFDWCNSAWSHTSRWIRALETGYYLSFWLMENLTCLWKSTFAQSQGCKCWEFPVQRWVSHSSFRAAPAPLWCAFWPD